MESVLVTDGPGGGGQHRMFVGRLVMQPGSQIHPFICSFPENKKT